MTNQSEIDHLVNHLFRYQSGKMVAVLTRIFGSENLELAEDVVQDSLVEALRQWTFKGIPDNPSGWLFKVAKNKALNIINREKYKKRYTTDVTHLLLSEWTAEPALDYLFSDVEVLDDELRMIFTCCHPAVSPDSQVALTLKTLCGFSIPEIAKAFLTNEENINKRLVRARKKIREGKIPFAVPYGDELDNRLQMVLETIYLLFNEGYSASTGKDLIRYEICEEAIRLTEIIAQHPAIVEKSNVYALLSLMELNASRFKARQDADGNILTLEEQDRSVWDYDLMNEGFKNLEKAAFEKQTSPYHILAAISAFHCSSKSYESTDWKSILSLYDCLVEIDDSPLVLLNRSIALSKVNGVEKAIEELQRIEKTAALESYHLFYSTQAEFYIQLNQFQSAIPPLEKAIHLAYLEPEKKLLKKRLDLCLGKNTLTKKSL